MTLLDCLESWFRSLEVFLSGLGVTGNVRRSPDDGRPKAFCGVSLRANAVEGELLLWDTGEAELNLMPRGGTPSQDHLEIGSVVELAGPLARVLATVSPPDKGSDAR